LYHEELKMKSAELKLRVSEEELVTWKTQADCEGIALSKWVRATLNRYSDTVRPGKAVDIALVKPVVEKTQLFIENQDLGRQLRVAQDKKLSVGRPAHHIRCVCSICNPEKEKK
jgi:hypothetical protein